jgi:hypothetical protein
MTPRVVIKRERNNVKRRVETLRKKVKKVGVGANTEVATEGARREALQGSRLKAEEKRGPSPGSRQKAPAFGSG